MLQEIQVIISILFWTILSLFPSQVDKEFPFLKQWELISCLPFPFNNIQLFSFM